MRYLVVVLFLLGTVSAQPTFTTIKVVDAVALDMEPLPNNLAPSIGVLVVRAALAPSARERLRLGLGLHSVFTPVTEAPGPAIFTRERWGRIPGERRLRIETDFALQILGLGASREETVRVAENEEWSQALLVGAHPDVTPAHGFVRVGPPPARPVIWARKLIVRPHPEDVSGGRKITIQDQYSWGKTRSVACAGKYPVHLQGVCTNADGDLYWSWTDRLVRTDAKGKVLAQLEAERHQGDLTWNDGKLVVAVNLGLFNDPKEKADSWLYIYDDQDLKLLSKHRLPRARFGAGGVCWTGERYVVVGGLPAELRNQAGVGNEVHEYDREFNHLRTVKIAGGWTEMGIQTAEFALGRLWFGCYGTPRSLLVASTDLQHVQRYEGVDAAYGIVRQEHERLLIGRDKRDPRGHAGTLHIARPDSRFGLNTLGR